MKIKKTDLINLSLIFLSSFFVNFYFGSIGVFPIDTFAFFDSSYYFTKQFLPIRDFWTSNGFFVDMLQGVFFKLFGVNWFVYLLHPSIINFIFAAITYKFFIEEGLSPYLSLFYSISVSILAYPSSGVPFPDHHSILISLIAVYFLIFALKNNRDFYWYLIPPLLLIAFISKQIPAAFFIIFISFYYIFFSFISRNYKVLFWGFLSTITVLLIFFLFLSFLKIGFKDFVIQYILFPLSIGNSRSDTLNLLSLLYLMTNELKFFSIICLSLLIIFLQERSKFRNKKNIIFETTFILLSSTVILILNQMLMKNQIIIFFLLPILVGLLHSQIKTNKKFLIYAIVLLNIFVVSKYHLRFNVDRKFIDIEYVSKTNLIDGNIISSKINGLRWVTKYTNKDNFDEVALIKQSIEFLRDKKGSIIITNYQFILSELEHDIYSPNRWYTSDGVSYPIKENKFHDYYKDFYQKKLIKNKVKKIYTIKPLDIKTFDFLLSKKCIITKEINIILSEHDISNCFG